MARAAGADVHPPEDTDWGQHEGAIVDPDGNVIRSARRSDERQPLERHRAPRSAGTVRVEQLCAAEPFAGVWQRSSQIAARPRPDVSLLDLFAALFPSGSITGAPKRAAMGLIDELEPYPRGVHCGAIGWAAPPGQAATRARFNVPIRTLAIDHSTGAAVYGIGGGITTDSDPAAEYAELLAKTAVLAAIADPDLELLETLLHPRRRVRPPGPTPGPAGPLLGGGPEPTERAGKRVLPAFAVTVGSSRRTVINEIFGRDSRLPPRRVEVAARSKD